MTKDDDYYKARKESKDRITKVIKVWDGKEEAIHDSGFEKGAEFAYNKANEWHYVKDGDLPADKTEKKYLVALKSEYGGFFYETDIWCESLHCFASNNPIKIYAWKEIVPPSEPMRSLDKEEQKNYTEAINKVYKPTGVKLFDKENG